MEVIFLQLHLNYISITFFFAYFCNLENLKHKLKISKTKQAQVKKRQKLRQEFGKTGKNKILLWYWRKLASSSNKSNLSPTNFQLHLLWNCQLLYIHFEILLQKSAKKLGENFFKIPVAWVTSSWNRIGTTNRNCPIIEEKSKLHHL